MSERNRGGKEAGLPRARAAFDDPADVGQETHVEHSVGFVEDEILHPVHPGGAPADVVQQAPRSGDQDVHAAAQGIILEPVADAAVHQARRAGS